MSNGTYIDGIASSQAIDTAGEVVSIAGMDISSLVGSVFNYEHKSDVPAQIVGKILFAKKIFEEGDCENDRQKNCWNSCQLPFLYVLGQLFDDYSPSAQEIAGVFLYDADNKDKLPTLGFSIEGSKIAKEGMIVTRSIARKVTITVAPANKTCLAEAVQPEDQGSEDDLSSIFKAEYTVDMVKAEEAATLLGIPMNKSEDEYKKGSIIGKTTSGKEVYSHGGVHAAPGFTSADHAEAAQMHQDIVNKTKGDAKTAQNHYTKYTLHNKAHMKLAAVDAKIKNASKAAVVKEPADPSSKNGKLFDPDLSGKMTPPGPKKEPIKKAMTADSGNAAPGQLSQGGALAKQSLGKYMKKAVMSKMPKHGGFETHRPEGMKGINPGGMTSSVLDDGVSAAGEKVRSKDMAGAKAKAKDTLKEMKAQPKPKLTKSEALIRAEQVYKAWTKRSDFEKFMADRMPNLTKGEIVAIGQTIALKKSLDAESELADLVNYAEPKSTLK